MHATALDIDLMRQGASEATAMLRSLTHEDRLLILCQLSQGELTVGELQASLDLAQPVLSQHLAHLRRQQLVIGRKVGRFVHYRVADPRVLQLLETLYQLFCPTPASPTAPGSKTDHA